MSDLFKEYKIPHAGLKKGVHEFAFELTDKFFSNFENALIQKCAVQVNVTLDNRQEPFVLEVDLDGTVFGDCDRCTASIPLSVHNSFTIYAKYVFDETMKEEEDLDIIYIAKDDTEIDITRFLYDYVHLSIPIHKICDNPGKTTYCDMDIIRRLERQQTENETDPRWAGLDKLKDNLN